MQLSQEALTEFKAIYREEFGDELTDEDALDAALRVLRFFKAMMTIEQEKSSKKWRTTPCHSCEKPALDPIGGRNPDE